MSDMEVPKHAAPHALRQGLLGQLQRFFALLAGQEYRRQLGTDVVAIRTAVENTTERRAFLSGYKPGYHTYLIRETPRRLTIRVR